MTELTFTLPDSSTTTVRVNALFNAGYAGCNQAEVQAHIDELAAIGVPGPSVTPTLYPVSPYLAQQTDVAWAQHATTSGEAEWALILSENGPLLTVACDHTDRALETHGVAWSKNAGPDVLGSEAWPLAEVEDHLEQIRLRAWVTAADGTEQLIQDSPVSALLTPAYWLDVLAGRGEDLVGTVLISGTIPMIPGVDQFAERWRVQLDDTVLSRQLELSYDVRRMPEPIG